jgi:hypothetical protein
MSFTPTAETPAGRNAQVAAARRELCTACVLGANPDGDGKAARIFLAGFAPDHPDFRQHVGGWVCDRHQNACPAP